MLFCLTVLPVWARGKSSRSSSSQNSSASSQTDIQSPSIEQQQNPQDSDTVKITVSEIPENYSLALYDNCPQNTACLTQEMNLRYSIPGYQGLLRLSIDSSSKTTDFSVFEEYISSCLSIKAALEKSTSAQYELSFNSEPDASGISVDLPSDLQASKSARKESLANALDYLISNQITDIYAIYTLKAQN